ncbi:MAG: hypothetical protein K9K34_19335 [Desulfarculaceae bacterium]|nr:hypothetical protein [Desulfarculaceae bacterium]
MKKNERNKGNVIVDINERKDEEEMIETPDRNTEGMDYYNECIGSDGLVCPYCGSDDVTREVLGGNTFVGLESPNEPYEISFSNYCEDCEETYETIHDEYISGVDEAEYQYEEITRVIHSYTNNCRIDN